MSEMIRSGLAMVKVLESWGVDHLYGIPGGSINSTMDALYERRGSIRYIQVRHEETGALAASADAKLSGKIGVCFGSAGPGATHLFNGLYDARMDHAPVLALIGQVASTAMNTDAFQELNENPMFADVSVYNRTVMTPESLPHVVDEAIRIACARNGVSVVTLPVDYGSKDIPDGFVSSASSLRTSQMTPEDRDIETAVALLQKAERPVLYVGQGARGCKDEILAVSRQFSMPVVSSVPAKGIVPDAAEQYMGSAGRVATKPANEALAHCDCILFVGSDFPFAAHFFPEHATFIQVDIDAAKLGRRHTTDAAILGDAGETLRRIAAHGVTRPESSFYDACRRNMRNWKAWLRGFATSDAMPMRVEPVFAHINRIAGDDAIFVTDVGNTTIHAVRLLDMNGAGQRFTTSGWFAAMGYAVPGGIAAKLSYPDRQVFTLNGDGGFAMAMQDVITQVKYNLPIINIVFSNDSFGFIEAEQEDARQTKYGVFLESADFAKAGEAMGAKGFSVRRRDELPDVFDEARQCERPVVIDVKIANERPFPAEAMALDPNKHAADDIRTFKERYHVTDLPTLEELL